jgi:hypothetical protein
MSNEREPPHSMLSDEPDSPRGAPPEQVPEHTLLALQRSAGNAAVARLLAGRRTLQRKIGFELEAGEWRSALLDRPLAMMEQQSGEVSKQARTTPPEARKAFYEKGNIKGTADELPGTDRDVEFVIKEQDESQADAIGADFDLVGAAFGEMHGKLPAKAWMWPEKRLGWSPPDPGVWLLDNPTRDRTVQMQATAGIRLDKIADLMEGLDPDATGPSNPLDDPRRQTGTHPGAGASLGRSYAIGFAAVEEFANQRSGVPALKQNLVGLIGLIALMAQMIDGGDAPPPDQQQAAYAYPKAMAHLLPRTDFAHLMGRLPDDLQIMLKAADPIDTAQPALVSLIQEACDQAGLGDIDKPVLGWSKWKQIEEGMIVPDLTRRAWAEGMVAGQDRLSQSGYLAWLESRKDTLDTGTYEKRKKESKQLDSLGAWKDKMDTRGTERLPLVEFRALVLDTLKRDMTIPEAKAVGLRLAAYIDRLASS